MEKMLIDTIKIVFLLQKVLKKTKWKLTKVVKSFVDKFFFVIFAYVFDEKNRHCVALNYM